MSTVSKDLALCYNLIRMDLLVLGSLLGSILLSMTLHEAMHAYTSFWLGDDTAVHAGRLSLNPLVHIDPFTTIALPILLVLSGLPPFGAAKPVPFNPSRVHYGEYGAALVGVSGPLTNLGLAMFGGGLMRIFEITSGTSYVIVGTFVLVNLSFFVFNMVPYPPLDGSRLLYAFAPESLRKIMLTIESTGIMGIMIFMFLAYTFIAPLISSAVVTLWDIFVGLPLV